MSSSLKSLFETAVTEITKQTEELSDYAFNAPEAAVMVRKATNSDAWGPSGTDMLRISNLSHRHAECRIIMDALWERLTKTSPKNWRNVYKALLLLDYLLKNGAERIIGEVRGQIFELKQLQKFQHIDEGDVDRGLSVRERSKQIIDLVHDTERLKEERRTAHQNRSKYSESISSESGGYVPRKTPYSSSSSSSKKTPSSFLDESDDDDHSPTPTYKSKAHTTTTFDDSDDDWGDFDKKVVAPTPIAAKPAQQATPVAAQQVFVQQPAPVQQKPALVQQKPQEVNPLDGLSIDLLGTGSLPTPEQKPLPNLFPTQQTPSGGSNLPNLFGTPTSTPNGPGNNLPNLFGAPTSQTQTGSGNLPNLFGAPTTGTSFGQQPVFGQQQAGTGFGQSASAFGGAPAGSTGMIGMPVGYGMNPGMTGMPAGYGYAYPQQPYGGAWGAYPPAGQ